jgi:tripartite-type tricarboxylate transporter receptor subunit TctC
VKVMFSSLVQTTPFIQSGQLRALGTGGEKRNPVLPEVPTIAEPACRATWRTTGGASSRPPGRRSRSLTGSTRTCRRCSKSPELTAAFAREGAGRRDHEHGGVHSYIETEIAKWGRVVKEGNIKAQ